MSAFIDGYLQKTANIEQFLSKAKDFAVKNKEALIGAGIGGLGGALAGGLTGEGGLGRAAIGGVLGAAGGGALGYAAQKNKWLERLIEYFKSKNKGEEPAPKPEVPAPKPEVPDPKGNGKKPNGNSTFVKDAVRLAWDPVGFALKDAKPIERQQDQESTLKDDEAAGQQTANTFNDVVNARNSALAAQMEQLKQNYER